MKQIYFKVLMFISSYCPLYVILLLLHFKEYRDLDSFKKVTFLVVMILALLVSFLSLVSLKGSSTKTKIIKCIERPDDTIISYMMTYVIPLITTNLAENNEIIINLMLFVLTGYLYIRLNLVYLNPLWSVVGFLTYRINNDGILITNIPYRLIKEFEKTQIPLKGYYIGNNIFIARKILNDPITPP